MLRLLLLVLLDGKDFCYSGFSSKSRNSNNFDELDSMI
jgi:hypothetical protein